MRTLAIALFVCLVAACKRDPLAEHLSLCRKLQGEKTLRPGLTLSQCAEELKARADLADPGRKAEELVERVARLVADGSGKPARGELRDALSDLKELGRPAEPATLARLLASPDGELRIALARVLVGICAEDCRRGRYECIVPALLEGTGKDRPPEVRVEAEKALARCTGEQLGDDPSAWQEWWAQKTGGRRTTASAR